MMRILFLSDTHLGFDFPFRPRVNRRRRGPDFFNNFRTALAPALSGEVDAVVHGGDLLFRSKVPPQLVTMAFEPLIKVADGGVPVYLVPGNHERSAIPYSLLAAHSKIHIFQKPHTFVQKNHDFRLALAGFPYVRRNIRNDFPAVLDHTGWKQAPADAYVLCMHHCVEGASLIMGTKYHVFRNNHDVIRLSDIPTDFSAVLSGHIHRFQVLTRNLQGQPLSVPIFYPGSVERTSFTEKDEDKGFLILELGKQNDEAGTGKGRLKQWRFHRLPARPMEQLDFHGTDKTAPQLSQLISSALARLSPDSVVKLRVHGHLHPEVLELLSAASIRTLVPPTMNVSVTLTHYHKPRFSN